MKKETTLVFTGDIGFDKYMDGKWRDDELLDEEIKAFLKSGDHVIANVEGPLFDSDKNKATSGTASLVHAMNPEVGEFLENIGADIWCLVNNHIMDAGPEGLMATLDKAGENNALTIGVGANIDEASKPLYLDEAGGIGIIGVGYQRACRKASEDTPGCFSWSDLELIEKRIKEIKEKCRWCIVVAHAGEEFTSLPAPYTRKRYMDYLDMGADIIVAHHPHVPMNYETVGDKIIFYSLGNFIFDTDYQRAQFNTEKGLLIKLNLSEESFSFEPMGLHIDREKEHIIKGNIPDIFTNVDEREYNLLEPLSAKAFISATKRQQIYFKPDVYKNATEEQWMENFMEPLRSGRVPGETLDMQIILPIAKEAEKGEWKKSKLEGVKQFILEQI
ncbi:MAG: CapA family protein [Lachnospiraceae bacterium]|nr:CapA family protein [Lachnospiraceae bacterium]